MKLAELENLQNLIFEINNDDSDNHLEWELLPLNEGVIKHEDGHFLVSAKYIDDKGKVIKCFINLTMPERIYDFVFFIEENVIIKKYPYEMEGDVVCAVPSEIYGNYEMYYSKKNPKIGIDILKNGLSKTQNKGAIAEDLGYILRDENMQKEAIEAFLIAEKNTPSSEYIYHELGQLYEAVGDKNKAQYYYDKAKVIS